MVLVPLGHCMLWKRQIRTSKNVSLIHVVCAENSDSASSAVLQQRPHLVSGAGVHACRGLVQEQDLTGTNMMQTAQNYFLLKSGKSLFQAPGTFGSPRMAMPTESFLFWPPLRFLA